MPARDTVDMASMSVRQRWATTALVALPVALFLGALLFAPLLPARLRTIGPLLGGLPALGALVLLPVVVREWTGSIVKAFLATATSVLCSIVAMMGLLFWAVTHTTYG
jgi:hypothetical protein